MAKYKHTPEKRPGPTPKQRKPWDRPPPPKIGDKHEHETYAAVGKALSTWERLEHTLGETFVNLVSPLPERSLEAMRAYSTVLANSSRLGMIGGAAEAFFLTRKEAWELRAQADLTTVLASVEHFAGRRNEIAHGIVTLKLDDDGDSKTAAYILAPSFYSKKSRELFAVEGGFVGFSPLYEYSSVELLRMDHSFAELGRSAIKVMHAIRRVRHIERRTLLRKSGEQPPGP